jgi:hypothetical protein
LSETDGPIRKGEDGRGIGRAWPLFVGLPLILGVVVPAVIFSGGERPGLAEQERAAQPAQEERPSDSGTPTFVINDTVVAGAQPLEVFEDAIEQAKEEAGRGG